MRALPTIAILSGSFFVMVKIAPADEPAALKPRPQRVLEQESTSWVKRSPLPKGPPNPMLGYEASFGYDPIARKIIRWAGHTQSGGHEQQNETWTYDPLTATFELLDTNLAPPGGCCVQQNVFDPVGNRFLRFRSFAGNHGWHWFRENYLSNTSVWSFELATRTWRNMRPLPEPMVSPLRCASWDAEHQVIVIFGGEGNQEGTVVYDTYLNTWARKHPRVQPAFRSAGNMAYDSKRKRHILFGSQFSDDPHTWAYSLNDNTWTDLKPKVQPPTDKNDAVLAYDERNDVVIANVNVMDGKAAIKGRYETWVYESAANTWKKMTTRENPPGYGSRRRIMCYVPDLNVTVMENYVNPAQRIDGVDREQQMWTYRHAQQPPAGAYKRPASKRTQPPLVEDVTASVLSERKVVLTWKPPAGTAPAGYHIERAVVDVFSEDQLHRLRKDTEPLSPPSVGGIRGIGAFERLTREPVKQPRFEDTTVDLTQPKEVS